jgi:hypothetical protein
MFPPLCHGAILHPGSDLKCHWEGYPATPTFQLIDNAMDLGFVLQNHFFSSVMSPRGTLTGAGTESRLDILLCR